VARVADHLRRPPRCLHRPQHPSTPCSEVRDAGDDAKHLYSLYNASSPIPEGWIGMDAYLRGWMYLLTVAKNGMKDGTKAGYRPLSTVRVRASAKRSGWLLWNPQGSEYVPERSRRGVRGGVLNRCRSRLGERRRRQGSWGIITRFQS